MAFKVFNKDPEPIKPDVKVVGEIGEIRFNKWIREEIVKRSGSYNYNSVRIEVDDMYKLVSFEFVEEDDNLAYCGCTGFILIPELLKAHRWIRPGDYDIKHDQGNRYIVDFKK